VARTKAAAAFGGLPTGRKRTLGRHGLHPRLHKLRRQYITEMSLRGYTIQSIGKQVNLGERTIKAELLAAGADGTIDEVRAELSKTLRKVPRVFDIIFDTPAADLQKHARGFALKMEAAKTLSEGMGTLRKETTQTTRRLNLHAYHEQRQLHADTETDVIDAASVVHRGHRLAGPSGADDDQFSRPQLGGGGFDGSAGEGPQGPPAVDAGGSRPDMDGDVLAYDHEDDGA
jgi:hypothetical protein